MAQSDCRDFSGGASDVHDLRLLVSCVRCERLHRADPLEFNPVCAACTARDSIMRSLEMNGSYPLDEGVIDAVLTREAPGNYALGYMDDETFVVFYVGRSDRDVGRSLRDWVGAPSRRDRYAPASKAAWTSRRSHLMPLGTPALGRVGLDVDSCYTHFAYSYAPSAEAAFEKECRNYDGLGGDRQLDNEARPVRTQPRC